MPLSLLRPLFSLELGGEGLQDDVREEDLTAALKIFETASIHAAGHVQKISEAIPGLEDHPWTSCQD